MELSAVGALAKAVYDKYQNIKALKDECKRARAITMAVCVFCTSIQGQGVDNFPIGNAVCMMRSGLDDAREVLELCTSRPREAKLRSGKYISKLKTAVASMLEGMQLLAPMLGGSNIELTRKLRAQVAEAEADAAEAMAAFESKLDDLVTDVTDSVGGEVREALGMALREQEARLAKMIGSGRGSSSASEAERLLRCLELPSAALDWKNAEEIGSGSFGVVYKLNCESFGLIAAKRLQMPSLRERENALVMLKREARVLAAIPHPNIITLHGISTDDPERCSLLLELAPGGSLRDLLDAPTEEFDAAAQLSVICGIARGMAALHLRSPPVLHRDLKSSNVLLFDGWRPKLTDFGIAKHEGLLTSLGAASRGNAGTFQYSAPEMFDDEPEFTPACDVYAFGVLMWELGNPGRLPPWQGKGFKTVLQKVVRDGRPDEAGSAIGLAGELAVLAWAPEPTARPTFAELRQRCDDAEKAARAAATKPLRGAVQALDPAAWRCGGRKAAEVGVTSAPVVAALALSPDGARLVGVGSSAAAAMVTVYEPSEAGCKVVKVLQGPTANVKCVAIDSAHIAAGDCDDGICLWSAQTLEPLGELPKQHSEPVTAMALAGNLLVSGSNDKTAKLWSLSARAVTATLAEHWFQVNAVAVSDAAIATSSGRTAHLWSREGGASRHELVHPNDVLGVAMAGDVLVSGCWDKIVRTFSVASGQRTRELRGHTGIVMCVALYGSMVLSGGGHNDRTVKVWALTGEASAECVATLEGHSAGVIPPGRDHYPSAEVKGVVAGAGWVAGQSAPWARGGAGELIVWRPA